MALSPWFRSREDSTALKCLLVLAVVYAIMSYAAYSIVHMHHVRPLGDDAPLSDFSEARALRHIRKLSVDIGGRQVSSKFQFLILFPKKEKEKKDS